MNPKMSNQKNNLFNNLNIETIKKLVYATDPLDIVNEKKTLNTEESKEIEVTPSSECKGKKPSIPKLNLNALIKKKNHNLNQSSIIPGNYHN